MSSHTVSIPVKHHFKRKYIVKKEIKINLMILGSLIKYPVLYYDKIYNLKKDISLEKNISIKYINIYKSLDNKCCDLIFCDDDELINNSCSKYIFVCKFG